MKENFFFETQTISSKIKANIISEYFPSYCNIITSKYQPKQVRYIDLFAGPGFYEDGNASTPILIGRHCSKNDLLRENVKLVFNDNFYHRSLKTNFNKEFPTGIFKKKCILVKAQLVKVKRLLNF